MKAALAGSRPLAPEVRHFDFTVPEVETLAYQPGQFVSLSQEIGGKLITRAYSISSAPRDNRFSLCLNRVPDGLFSPWLFAMREGDSVEMKPPLGTFVIRNPDRDIMMVATGTGIAPFRAMLEQRQRHRPANRCTLVFGVRHEEGLLYRHDLETMARAGIVDFRPTLSRPGESWQGRRGHVQEPALEAIGERRDLDIYICGLKLMVDDLRSRLKALGFDRKQIIYEKYD